MFTILLAFGFLFIILGLIILLLSSFKETGERSESAAGGVVIIGPIPIVFGTTIKVVKIVLILAIILTVLTILLTILVLKVSI